MTDAGFDRSSHQGLSRYARGEGKEGVGMGGALALADRAGVPMEDVRRLSVEVYDSIVADEG